MILCHRIMISFLGLPEAHFLQDNAFCKWAAIFGIGALLRERVFIIQKILAVGLDPIVEIMASDHKKSSPEQSAKNISTMFRRTL